MRQSTLVLAVCCLLAYVALGAADDCKKKISLTVIYTLKEQPCNKIAGKDSKEKGQCEIDFCTDDSLDEIKKFVDNGKNYGIKILEIKFNKLEIQV